MHDDKATTTDETATTVAADETPTVPTPWRKGGPSPNPKGRPKQPKTVAEVRALAREKTVQMIEVLSKVALNPKCPPAARAAAASSILDRAWGKPASFDLENAEQLVIRVIRFGEQPDESNLKVIEHDDEVGND
jgi:hypothetical protein